MSPEQFRRMDEIFEQVVDLPLLEQRRALASACGEDHELEQSVLELIEADAGGKTVLDRGVASIADEMLEVGVEDGPLPERFGAYTVKRLIGRGGMGTVYLAERDLLEGQVAIKVLNHGWDSALDRRRFASEQRTLSKLTHANIARLYEAGIEKGTPWFAMEYVDGVPISDYCQQHALNLYERLKLFRAACHATAYAHRMLIVHRDLKPSNILVNSEGEVKLVDFGIAKPLNLSGNTATLVRQFSWDYAAPEQVRGQTAVVQTDVYALGIILYKLLTGRVPMEITAASFLDLSRWLDEEVEPPSGAARRRPSQWRDLDLLCTTACAKQLERRYRSADDLIRDVDHFLQNEPLEAHPPSLRYRAGKFWVRNRRALSVTVIVLAGVLVMAVLFTRRLVSARNQALELQARTERIHRLMVNLFAGDEEAAGPAQDLKVVTLLDRGLAGIAGFKDDPAAQADLQSTMGELYQELGLLDRAEPLLRSAWAGRKAALGPADPNSIRCEITLALFLLDVDKTAEAERLMKDASVKMGASHRADSTLRAYLSLGLGQLASASGDYHLAVSLLDEAVRLYSASPATNDLSEALGALANAQYYLGQVGPSEATNKRALEMDRQLFGEMDPHVAVDLFNIGAVALDRGQYAQAEALFRRSLQINIDWYSARHPKSAAGMLMLGRALEYQRRYPEAGDLYARAMKIYQNVYGDEHQRIAYALNFQGSLSLDLGQLDDAEQQFSRSAAIFKKLLGDRHEYYAHQLSNLGAVYLKKKEFARAEQSIGAALDRLSPAVPRHRYTAIAHTRMAEALIGETKYREAEPHALTAYSVLESLGGISSEELEAARQALIAIYTHLGETEKLKQYAQRPVSATAK